MPSLTARRLRKNATDAERILWRHLRNKQIAGFRFRRQHPLGRFVADFVCLDRCLVVEVDGGQHAESARDDQRSSDLNKMGFVVLRIWNNEVFKNLDAVKEKILMALISNKGTPHLNPPPQGGRKSEAMR